MECMSNHPNLQGVRRFYLVTQDSHGLYAQFGFRVVAEPDRHMEQITLANDFYRESKDEMCNAYGCTLNM